MIRRYIVFLFLILFLTPSFSQRIRNADGYSLYISQGIIYSTAIFKYGVNNINKNYNPKSSYGFSLGLSKNIYDNIDLNVEFGYKPYGTKYSQVGSETYINLNYLDLSTLVIYKINLSNQSRLCCGTSLSSIYPLIGGGLYSSFLLDGHQFVSGNYLDVVEDDLIDRFDFGILVDIGFGIFLNSKLEFITKLRFNYGLYNVEGKDKSKNQSSYNRAMALFMTIAYSI